MSIVTRIDTATKIQNDKMIKSTNGIKKDNILFMKGAFMSGEIPIDPEDMGVEIEKDKTETTPQEEPIDSTTTGSGNESIGGTGGESAGSPSQTETAKKSISPQASGSTSKGASHLSGGDGEGLIKSGEELGKAIGDEVDILRPLE